ncbi:MAG: glycosyltransferase family 4 protein [Candidatus Thorarchaeota archaeon]
MIKILVFSPNNVEFGRGGEISSMELASALNNFYNVSFIDTNISPGEKILTKATIENRLKGIKSRSQIKYASIHLGPWTFTFPYPLEVIRLFSNIKKNNVIYISYSDLKTSIMFILSNLIYRDKKLIIGYRRPLYSKKIFSLYNLKYRISILLLSLFKKRVYHHALSHYAKEFLQNFYSPEKVIHIIHGIGLDNYKNSDLKSKQREVLNFLYVGELIEIPKGFGVLLNAIKQFLDEYGDLKVFFEFCGLGPLESKLKELEKLFPNHIRYHGYVSNDLIPEIYKRNDVFLFSSRREPFPRVLMEALAGNLVIICSKTIGSIELLKKKEFALFLNELTSNEIKTKILEIYRKWEKDYHEFSRLQESAKQYVFDNFSHEMEIEGFRKLINSIMR